MPVKTAIDNPILQPPDTPFGAPAFDRIRIEHLPPALEEGMGEERREIEAIAADPSPPTFANTILALERAGRLIRRVRKVFDNLVSANTNDQLQDIARDVAPKLARHIDDILLDRRLYARVRSVYDRRDSLDLDVEDRTLLEETHKIFVRGGAALAEDARQELRQLNATLASLTVEFGDNSRRETQEFQLVVDDPADLAGLPEAVRAAAADTAAERGLAGRWVFTLDKPSLIPFLQHAEARHLRERLYRGYLDRARRGQRDNRPVASRIASLRARRARLLGYPSHAHYVLERNMAGEPDQVYGLLRRLWAPALERARREAAEMQAMIDAEGGGFQLQPWDWWFYAEKVRQQRYDFDEEALKPYFALEQVRDGAFDVAHRLFGITFERRRDVPVYDPEVEVFEVRDADGSHLGLFYTDFHPRPGKRVGAWMNSYREQSMDGQEEVRPLVVNVCNFPRPTADAPALLSFEEVNTLFHEFGHALHGLLARGRYASLSGTSVARDFVELPSQIMENWTAEPEVLARYARHHRTGEPIPAELVAKMKRASRFNQGFFTVEYLAASFLDLAWHTLEDDRPRDADQLENEAMAEIGLIPEVLPRYRTPYFNHIFSGGYSAGYYSYIWAEVLDADAFEAFKQQGLFDRRLAGSWRREVLARGRTEPPMTLYRRFRGAEPSIEPLLERRGLGG